MFKNAVVGIYEIDLAFIYFKEKHAIFNQWVGISNPTAKNFNELSGYLKISASVIGPGDEQVALNDGPNLDRTDKEMMLLPPHISMKYYQLKFRLIKAEKLPKMDTFGTCDAFVKVNYLGKSIKTSVVTQKKEQLYWAQEIWLPMQYPLVSSRIVMQVYDADTASDDLFGSIGFNIAKYIERSRENQKSEWLWKDIYGSAHNVSGTWTSKMNRIPEIASHWKGRICMQVVAEETEKPEMKMRNVTDEVMQEAANEGMFNNTRYEIKAEVRQGICLPDRKLKVKIKIGDFEIKTRSPKKYGNGFCYWNYTFEEKIWDAPYSSVEKMADVCIYLMDGDSPICYYRCKASEFKNPNAELKWVALINDKSVGDISKAYKAGMISFRLSIHNQDEFGDVDWDYVPAWSFDLSDDPDKYPIRVNVYQCKELPPSDDNGTSDPYVKIWSPFSPKDSEKKMMTTRVVNDNNNPIFYNTLQSYFYSVDYDWAPPVVLDIYDQDSGAFSTDDFIGRAVIFLNSEDESISRNEQRAIPQWYPIKLGFREEEPAMGQILVSFNILDPNQKFTESLYDIRLAPACEEYEITINVLGLRNLESPGILPVRKAFVNFMLRSLLPPHKAHAVENISTQPSVTGPDPTISTVVRFSLYLPNDPLYCPSLTCGVYDYIFKGYSQPLIGNFVIPIGDLQHLQNDLFESEDKRTMEIIRALSAKIESAEEDKKEMEEKRLEAQREKEREEEMKKNLKEKQDLKDREELLSKQKIIKSFLKKPKGYKAIGEDEDLEMGAIEMTEQNNSMNIEETKEEEEKKASIFQQNLDEDIEEEEGDEAKEKEKAKLIINQKFVQKNLLKEQRTLRIKKMFRQMKLVGKNVVYPTYEYDDRLKIHREGITPPKEVFIPVGYDPQHDSKQKHYRRFYEDELENIEEVMPRSPFQTFKILRGKARGNSKSWFSSQTEDESGSITTVREVGKFKGIVSVINKQREEGFETVKKTRVAILKDSINSLSEALFDEKFDFNYDEIKTAEGRELF